MSDAQVRSLARRLASLEKWRLQSKQPNLGFSTIEGGAVQAVDEDGTVRSVIGQQEDGTYTQVDKNGPPPPTPLEPTVDTQPGLLVVSSYGLTVGDAPWPSDFRRLDVHVSASPDFTPDLNTRVSEFSVEGGAVSLALPVGTYYVKLVAVSTSGTKSTPSAEISRTVSPPATGAGGAALYHSDSPPVGLGASDQALWFDTDNGNLQSFWDGNSWEPMPLGAEATAEDVIAGKKVPLASRIELQWGVPDPVIAPEMPYASLEPLYTVPFAPSGDPADYSHNGLAVDETGKYVQFEGVQDSVTGNYYYRRVYVDPAAGGAVTYSPIMDIFSELETITGGQQVNKYNPQGLTKIGTTWYVLSWSFFNGLRLFSFNEAWELITHKAVGPTDGNADKYHGFSNDGTNILILKDMDAFTGGTAPTVIEKHNPATWGTGTGSGTAPVSSLTVTTSNPELFNPLEILPLANYSFGAPRYVMLASVGDWFPGYRAIIIDSTGAEVDRYNLNFGLFSNDGGTGIRWNSTTSRFEFAGGYGTIWRNTLNASDENVWLAYTLYDSIADPDTHESALSPVTTTTIPVSRWNGIMVYAEVPDVDDDQAPDTIRIYGRVGDATQPSAANMDLQVSIPHVDGVAYSVNGARFVPDPANGGAAPPVVSSFPAAPSGELVSELGGMIWRGDGTVDIPHLDRKYDARFGGMFASKGHDHPELEGRFSALQSTGADHETRLDSAEADITTLETNSTSMSAALTAIGARDGTFPTASTTASGSYTRAIEFVRIGNLVLAFGEVDRASGFNSSMHDTGCRIPVGFRPVSNYTGAAMSIFNGSATYRFKWNTTGVVEVQQSAAISQFQVAQAQWITADAMP